MTQLPAVNAPALARSRRRRAATVAVALCVAAAGLATTATPAGASGAGGTVVRSGSGQSVRSQSVRTMPGRAPINDLAELARRAVHAVPLPASATSLEGVLTRIWLDPVSGSHSVPERAATWIVGDAGRVQVPAEQVDGVPSGSWLQVQLDGATGQGRPRRLRRVSVLSRAGDQVSGQSTATGAQSDGTARLAASGTTAAATTTTSPHTVTLVLVRPPGATPDSMTLATMRTRIAEASTYWNTQSRGRLTFSVSKVYTAASTKDWLSTRASCSQYYTLWQEVAVKVGFSTKTARNHLVLYVPPGTAGCSAGLGTIGTNMDSWGYLYVSGNLTGLVAHELGHNMSLGHSNGLQCDGVSDGVPTVTTSGTTSTTTWSNGCTVKGYRDYYDVMGISWSYLGTLSTFHARRLGVLPASQLITVSTPSRVTLSPVGILSGYVSLQVVDPSGPVYTVEYRAASGADAWLSNNYKGLKPGVIVRRPDPVDGTQTVLLDGSPSAPSAWASDWDQPATSAGMTTASGRVRIRVESMTSSSATVAVSVNGVDPAPPAGSGTRVGASVDVASRTPGTAAGVRPSAASAPVTVTARGTAPIRTASARSVVTGHR